MIAERLHNQKLVDSSLRSPAAVIAWMGAVQAQEFQPATWALGQRVAGLTADRVERAFTSGTILRTHVLRPTWHFVTPADIRWMLALTGPRIAARMGPYNRRLELDARVFARSLAVIERALAGGVFLTRGELADRLAEGGIVARGQRLAHLMLQAEIDAVVCSGPRRGKRFTYALLAERAPRARRLSREESLAELAGRYFRSHGPATLLDFCWWSGLTMPEVRSAVELATPRLASRTVDGRTYWSVAAREARGGAAAIRTGFAHLLPIYDEYFIAYKDRGVVVPARTGIGKRLITDPFAHQLMLDGQLAGEWRWQNGDDGATVRARFYGRPSRAARRGVEAAAERLSAFLTRPVRVSFS